MPPDVTESPMARARTTRRLWIWGSVGCALLAWQVFLWGSSDPISTTLSDGSVVSYVGIQKGVKVSGGDFEPDVYAYPKEWFLTIPQRNEAKISRANSPPAAEPEDTHCYYSAPALMMLEKSGDQTINAILNDGFGGEQRYRFLNGCINGVGSQRYPSLPLRSPAWTIKLQDTDKHPLGEFVVPNQSFTKAPQFVGQALPLETSNSKGTLKLLSANYSDATRYFDIRFRSVMLEFDATGCPDLLPCHVIGARFTDSWGNTDFVSSSLSCDGSRIQVECPVGALQSEDWHIKIAICRGYGASFADDEIAIFGKELPIPSKSHSITAMKRTIRGRQLILHKGRFAGNAPASWEAPLRWAVCDFDWELDRHGPLLWPILVKAIGRTLDGSAMEVDPKKYEGQATKAGYQIERQRYNYPQRGGMTDDFFFDAYFKLPPDLKEIDLHVALEEPQVFEFFAKVSNWPAAPSKTQDSRK